MEVNYKGRQIYIMVLVLQSFFIAKKELAISSSNFALFCYNPQGFVFKKVAKMKYTQGQFLGVNLHQKWSSIICIK
jgi:hypothetical protein